MGTFAMVASVRNGRIEVANRVVGASTAVGEGELQAWRSGRNNALMVSRFKIDIAVTAEDLRGVSDLFEGYAASLPVDLGYQDFAAELAGLPGKYAEPKGALLLARDPAGAPLGCIALRPLDGETCEMKRLFLLPEARGMGLGRALAEAIITAARDRGYRELRLDTLPSMTSAIALYEGLGFERIEPYYAPTPPGTVFMALAL